MKGKRSRSRASLGAKPDRSAVLPLVSGTVLALALILGIGAVASVLCARGIGRPEGLERVALFALFAGALCGGALCASRRGKMPLVWSMAVAGVLAVIWLVAGAIWGLPGLGTAICRLAALALGAAAAGVLVAMRKH